MCICAIKRPSGDELDGAIKKNPHFDRGSVEIGQRGATLTNVAGDRNFQHKRTRYVTWPGADFSDRSTQARDPSDECTRAAVTSAGPCVHARPPPTSPPLPVRMLIYARPMRRQTTNAMTTSYVADVSVQWNVGPLDSAAEPYLVCYILRDRSRIEPETQRVMNYFFPAPARTSRNTYIVKRVRCDILIRLVSLYYPDVRSGEYKETCASLENNTASFLLHIRILLDDE